MKITKRFWHSSPMRSIIIWFMPLLTYLMQKVGGGQFNQYEWLWWVGIPALFVLWLVINFKINKNDNKTISNLNNNL